MFVLLSFALLLDLSISSEWFGIPTAGRLHNAAAQQPVYTTPPAKKEVIRVQRETNRVFEALTQLLAGGNSPTASLLYQATSPALQAGDGPQHQLLRVAEQPDWHHPRAGRGPGRLHRLRLPSIQYFTIAPEIHIHSQPSISAFELWRESRVRTSISPHMFIIHTCRRYMKYICLDQICTPKANHWCKRFL